MERFTVMPWLVALLAGLAAMPATNVFKICAWNVGTSAVDPWRVKSAGAVRSVAHGIRAWLTSLITGRRLAFACLAALLAIMVSQLGAEHAGVLMAIGPIAAAGAPDAATLQTRRAALLREADALRPNGQFADDAARTAFDEKLAQVEAIDAQLRTLSGAPAPTPAADAAAIEAARTAAIAEERTRGAAIRDVVARATKMNKSVAIDGEDMIRRGLTIEQARSEVFAKLSTASEATRENPHHVDLGEDARDKFMRGGVAWLLQRSGMADLVSRHEKTQDALASPGEFRGMTLLDMAREFLMRQGVAVRGLDRMEIAGRALSYRATGNYQTTSDFATLLENALHKVLRGAYAITPDTWSRWCGTGTVQDFRSHNWYRLGSLTSLDDLNEQGEFKNKAIPDAEKATFAATTKGNIIGITRQVIVNDDLGAVMRLTEMLGRAGKLTIEKAAYALLGLNSGLGPTQSDSQPLFHANRSNVGTSAAISMAALDADAVVMASQKDPNGQDILDLPPAVLLVPRSLGGTAKSINGAEYDPDTTGKLQKPNIVKNMFKDVVDTARLSGTRRYLFADPALYPVVLVSFLEGQREPILETQDGWRTDGVEMKARLDFGVDVVDYRGAVTNAGT